MSDDNLDTTPATPEPVTATADTAPGGTPPPAPTQQADDLDLLDADADDGDDAGEGEPAETETETDDEERPAWRRPEGLEGDAIAEWKEAQGLPTEADDYLIDLELGEGQSITETGQQLIDGLRQIGLDDDLPPTVPDKIAKLYQKVRSAQEAKLAEADKTLRKATRDTLTQKWASAYDQRIEVAKAGARLLPEGLREALKTARAQDGRRVSDTPEFAEALLAIGRLTQKGKNVPTSDEDRVAEITQVMNTDIDRYQREGLDKEYLNLMRKRDAVPVRTVVLSPAEEAEERDLMQMMHTDIDTYAHRPYRGTGRPAADRLLELRRKKAGEAA